MHVDEVIAKIGEHMEKVFEEDQDVVLNDDVFDVQSLSVLYFAKK